jgi:hypothetical protein
MSLYTLYVLRVQVFSPLARSDGGVPRSGEGVIGGYLLAGVRLSLNTPSRPHGRTPPSTSAKAAVDEGGKYVVYSYLSVAHPSRHCCATHLRVRGVKCSCWSAGKVRFETLAGICGFKGKRPLYSIFLPQRAAMGEYPKGEGVFVAVSLVNASLD